MSRVVFVIPLRAGASGRLASLFRYGLPLDVAAAELERHHVFVTDEEAVVVLEAESRDRLEQLVSELGASTVWADLASGPPRIADDVYDWIRPEIPDNVVYTATPGPGDSDGGDLYAP